MIAMGKTAEADRSAAAKPEFPMALNYLWTDFVHLDRRARPPGMAGIASIPPSEYRHYAWLLGFEYDSWEVEALWALDDLRVAVPSQVTVTGKGANDP